MRMLRGCMLPKSFFSTRNIAVFAVILSLELLTREQLQLQIFSLIFLVYNSLTRIFSCVMCLKSIK